MATCPVPRKPNAVPSNAGLGLELTAEAKFLLADRGYDPTLGARPLRHAIQRLVEDPLSERLLYKEWRDPGEEPKLHLFGQLKRITKQWLDTCLVCKGGTYPALLLYEDLLSVGLAGLHSVVDAADQAAATAALLIATEPDVPEPATAG